ncbi:MAG: asparaginase domain-containing protein [Phycisphaerales bacterium]
MWNIELLTTGGTIEKTYDEGSGELSNKRSIVPRMLKRLRLEDTNVNVRNLMSKDSQLMTDADRTLITKTVRAMSELADGIVILHGTDTLPLTGDTLHNKLPDITVPVVLTGAMRPFEMVRSDALQNLTEALIATKLLSPGIYVSAHSNVLKFPGVTKSYDKGTFIKQP